MVLRLNLCMHGQMDTFMSVRMWIILQATSGGPHGTADCGKQNRWVCGQKAPPRAVLYCTSTEVLFYIAPLEHSGGFTTSTRGFTSNLLCDECFSESQHCHPKCKEMLHCRKLQLTECLSPLRDL
ncbi:hypothetical protein GOODEAATRI_003994 [Goodea atripinnis]|uniref:Uncharacterized protein n=1 Tax=Goodea atripinnis TaxID=208336 RepID=A0ABV0P4W6_9TELE